MYRFLRTPKWLIAHLVVLGVVAVCVQLGFWQLHRLDYRRELNAQISSRSRQPTSNIESLLPLDVSDEWRSVSATGRFITSEEIVLRGRPRGQQPGNHVLTPLRLTSGQILLVDRGWVPLGQDRPPVRVARPTSETATVTGLLVRSEAPLVKGQQTAAPRVNAIGRIDLQRLGGQLPGGLLNLYLLAQDQVPAPSSLPKFVAPPIRDEGPHKSYAVQWFIFGVIALIVYGALIRKTARAMGEVSSSAPPG